MCTRFILFSVVKHNLKLRVFKVTSFGLILDIIMNFFFLKTFSGHSLLQIGTGSHPLQDA